MKEFFGKIKEFAKRHTFKFVVIVLLSAGMLVDIGQSTAIVAFDKSLDNHKKEIASKLDTYHEQYNESIERNSKEFSNKLEAFNSTLGARIDTLDSTIDPELKRRILVKNIRDAVTENTDTRISIKNLNRIANAVIDYSYEQNLPMAMVLAQMKQESDFNVHAKSHAHAKGLMQILDHPQRSTANEIAGELGYRGYNIWDIRVNIRFGCYYMRKMLTAQHNNYGDALRAYNFGPHNVAALKAGDIDYSLSKVVQEDGEEKQYLVDKYGEFELDDEGNRIEVREEHKYPRETRDYVKKVTHWRKVFAQYGLDKVE